MFECVCVDLLFVCMSVYICGVCVCACACAGGICEPMNVIYLGGYVCIGMWVLPLYVCLCVCEHACVHGQVDAYLGVCCVFTWVHMGQCVNVALPCLQVPSGCA